MASEVRQDKANELVSNVSLRGEAWWHDPKNSLRTALSEVAVPESLKLWVGDVAVQAWTEGAITSVQEYGDEIRIAADISKEAVEQLADDLSDNADLDAAEGGNTNVCDMEWRAAKLLRAQSAENERLRKRVAELEAHIHRLSHAGAQFEALLIPKSNHHDDYKTVFSSTAKKWRQVQDDAVRAALKGGDA